MAAANAVASQLDETSETPYAQTFDVWGVNAGFVEEIRRFQELVNGLAPQREARRLGISAREPLSQAQHGPDRPKAPRR